MSKRNSKFLIAILPLILSAWLKTNESPFAFLTLIATIFIIGITIFFQLDANILLYLAELYVQKNPSILRKTFNNKVTLIAGASDGIGAETARQLCRQTNANIILLARTYEKLEKVQKECEEIAKSHSSGASLVISACDVTRGTAEISSSLEEALKKLQKANVDIVVISAGRAYERKLEETDMELIRSTFELNVMGAISTFKAFASHCSKDCKIIKHVILISSLVGKMPTALCAGYSASKAAANLFFDTVRAEHADDFRVTTVCPGPVATNIFEASAAAMGQTLDQETKNAMKHMMTVERAVNLVLAGCVARPSCLFFELWITAQPLLLFTYMNQFLPGLIKHFASSRMKNKRQW